jgi:hypothetical protein
MIKKILIALVVVPLCLFLFLFWLGYLSSRPPLTTDPATLAGDGSTLNYCDLPELPPISPRAIPRAAATRISPCRSWPSAPSHCQRALTISVAFGWV